LIVISLPKRLEARLNNLAMRTGRTPASLAREAIMRYLEENECLLLAEVEAKRTCGEETQTSRFSQSRFQSHQGSTGKQ
jgi:predicted DNA-binding protein